MQDCPLATGMGRTGHKQNQARARDIINRESSHWGGEEQEQEKEWGQAQQDLTVAEHPPQEMGM